FTTIVNTAVSPAATVAFENTTLPVPPTAGAVMLQPLPVVTTADTNVVLAGTASVTVTVCASLGPLLAKLIVYVRLFPAITGSGESVLVAARSACTITFVVVVLLLLPDAGSVVVLVTDAVLLITVLAVVLLGTFTTISNVAVSPAATVALENVTLPPVVHPV